VVNFDTKMRGPAHPTVFTILTDWTKNTNDSIKYYSGIAYYHNTFKLEKIGVGQIALLDLGMAKAIAKVKVNGVELGGAWTAPYKIDITRALKSGDNEVEIKVVNTWVNRLIGDKRLPENERKTWTIDDPYRRRSPLESSGLLGPVKIQLIRY
jgi:hypothetical protein